jgi:hypothetical protein
MTTATLKQSQTSAPPPATSMAVRAYGKTLALKIDALKLGAAQLVLDEARGKTGAFEALTDLYLKLKILEFALELNGQAVALAMAEDQSAAEAWRKAIQTLDPDEIVRGISKSGCCNLCSPGSYCVISGSVSHAADVCSHPILSQHLQFLDETGRRHFRYADHPRAAEIFAVAARKLKVSS